MNMRMPLLVTFACALCVMSACDSGSESGGASPLVDAAMLVKSGQGVSEAAGFIAGQIPHKLVMIDFANSTTLSGGSDWPASWFASSISDLQVVLCQIDFTFVPKEQDGFHGAFTVNGENVTLAAEETWVLRDARTGQDVAAHTFVPSPQSSDLWSNIGASRAGEPRHWLGVRTETIIDWARSFIE